MKIAIDIDEVVVDFVEKYMEFVETRGIKGVNYENVDCYELWEVLGITRDKFMILLNEYNESKYFREVKFIDGAKDGICFLRDNFDICFITARPESISKRTKDFVFREFGILENSVVFSGDNFGKNKNKDDICKDLGIGLIIEDSGLDSLKYAENGIKVLLLDKPWNQEFEHGRIFRCKDWGEILAKIEELKNGKVF